MEVFKAGDVVEFHMGGPQMTVEWHRQTPTQIARMPVQPAGVQCVWFDKTNQLRRALIAPALLKLYEIPTC